MKSNEQKYVLYYISGVLDHKYSKGKSKSFIKKKNF